MAFAVRSTAPQDAAGRRRSASAAIHAILRGRELPAHLVGLNDREMLSRIARADAKKLLDAIRDVYGLRYWDKETFRAAVLEGAFGGWRPGMLVRETPEGLRLVSTTCPIASDVERDARLCTLCQDIQLHATYLALVGQVDGVRFDRLMAKGEGACEMTIRWRPR